MTYIQFHMYFILPPLVVAMLLASKEFYRSRPKALLSVVLMSALAFVYTTPWDSFLIHQGVWWYSNDNVIGTIFKIPYEEYMFFFLQTWIASGIFLFEVHIQKQRDALTNHDVRHQEKNHFFYR